jgi:LPS-assembly lipoprotein
VRAVACALLLLLLLLAGCGFHFRQAPDLPPQMRKIYVAAPGGNGDLLRELRRGLESDDTQVLEDPTQATTILSIISANRRSRPIAINRQGAALEYEVLYQVEFSLVVEGVTVIRPQSVTLRRTYAYSISNAIANEEQEDTLDKAIAKDISQFIIFRVTAAAKNVAAVYSFPSAVTAPPPATAVAPAAATLPAPAPASAPPPV